MIKKRGRRRKAAGRSVEGTRTLLCLYSVALLEFFKKSYSCITRCVIKKKLELRHGNLHLGHPTWGRGGRGQRSSSGFDTGLVFRAPAALAG